MELDLILQLFAPSTNGRALLVIDCRRGGVLTVFPGEDGQKENHAWENCQVLKNELVAGLDKLPFRAGTFGAVFLCGMEENSLGREVSARELLEKVFDLLHMDGVLLFAYDNRYSPTYLLRRARNICRHRKSATGLQGRSRIGEYFDVLRCSFRCLLPWRVYEKLLFETGYSELQSYGAPKGYNLPCLMSQDKSVCSYYYSKFGPPRKFLKKMMVTFCNFFQITSHLSYSSVIMCKKNE